MLPLQLQVPAVAGECWASLSPTPSHCCPISQSLYARSSHLCSLSPSYSYSYHPTMQEATATELIEFTRGALVLLHIDKHPHAPQSTRLAVLFLPQRALLSPTHHDQDSTLGGFA